MSALTTIVHEPQLMPNMTAFEMQAAIAALAKLGAASMPKITLRQAMDACLEQKALGLRRRNYLGSLRQYWNQFARGRESMLIREITVEHLDQWFKDRHESPSCRSSNIGRLSALFAFAHRRGWIAENPCMRLERATTIRSEPFILNLEQCAKLMYRTERFKPCALAYLTLTLFAGVRPAETRGISWDDITDQYIKVSARASKVRTRRIVELQETAVLWLERARLLGSTLPVSHMTHRRYTRSFRQLLGFTEWPQDCLRHSLISYLLATREDAAYVAFHCGTSTSMVHRHYKALVEKSAGEKFFNAIRPRPLLTLLDCPLDEGELARMANTITKPAKTVSRYYGLKSA